MISYPHHKKKATQSKLITEYKRRFRGIIKRDNQHVTIQDVAKSFARKLGIG